MSPLAHHLRRHPALRALASPLLAVRRRLRHPGRTYERRVWGRLQALLAEDPVVHVEAYGGTFRLDARSDVFRRLLLEGHYEPEIAALCRRFAPRDRDAVDVGANAGFFSVLLGGHLAGRRVLAVEPSATMLPRLRDNLERNGMAERVVVFEGAASDRSGQADLTALEGREEYGTLGVLVHPAVRAEADVATVRTVPTRTLDALVADHALDPGFVKVDVEGAEHLVLGGAEQTLRDHRPVVLTEINDRLLRANGSSARAVLARFERAGYRVLDPLDPDLRAVALRDLEAPHGLEEILCLPDELA